jgi:hypothetical protein
LKLSVDFTESVHGKAWAQCSATERDEATLTKRLFSTTDGQKWLQWLGSTSMAAMVGAKPEDVEQIRGRQSVLFSIYAQIRTCEQQQGPADE